MIDAGGMTGVASLVAVPSASLRAGEDVSFSLFLDLGNQSGPVLFADSGRVLDGEKLERLKDSGVDQFWIPRDQIGLFYKHLEKGLEGNLIDPDIPVAEKSTILHSVAMNGAETLLKKRPTRSTLRRVSGIVESAVAALETTPALAREVRNMLTAGTELHQHSVNTSLYSLSLGMELYKGDLEAVRVLALACLLHDLGRAPETPDSDKIQPGTLYGEADYEPDYDHTTMGARLLMEMDCDEEVVLAAAEHHERTDGSGAPYGLAGDDICPTAQVVSLLNVFDHIRNDQPNFSGVFDAFKVMLESYRECFNPHVIQIFLKTFSSR